MSNENKEEVFNPDVIFNSEEKKDENLHEKIPPIQPDTNISKKKRTSKPPMKTIEELESVKQEIEGSVDQTVLQGISKLTNDMKLEETKKKEKPEEPVYEEDVIEETVIKDNEATKEIKELQDKLAELIEKQYKPVFIVEDETKEAVKTEAVVDKEEKVISEDETIKLDKETDETLEEIANRTNKFKMFGGNAPGFEKEVCSLAGDSNTIREIKKYKINEEKIIGNASNSSKLEAAFNAQYLNPANSPLVARITRVPLLLSGYYAEMSAADYGDMFSISRLAADEKTRFSKLFTAQLMLLYKKLIFASFSKGKPDPDEWLKKTYMPDINQLYYGIFDATFPGRTTYQITCGKEDCGYEFDVVKENRELNFAMRKSITPEFIRNLLTLKTTPEELMKTDIYKEAHTPYNKKVLTDYQYKVCYRVPTLYDMVEWLDVFDQELKDNFDDFDGVTDVTKSEHPVLKMLTYISSLIVPVIIGKNTEGKDVINFYTIDTTIEDNEKRMGNRRLIVKLLMALPKEIFRELFRGEEVRSLLTLKGMIHMLHNVKCPNCGTMLVRIPLDMSTIFFTEATRTVGLISQY
jgi:hypothetical protein